MKNNSTKSFFLYGCCRCSDLQIAKQQKETKVQPETVALLLKQVQIQQQPLEGALSLGCLGGGKGFFFV